MTEFTVTVSNSKGFHLRPASKLLQLATDFENAKIHLHQKNSGRSADCRNMMALMMMSSPQGTEFHVQVDADEAIAEQVRQAIYDLFDNGFGDES